MADLDFAADYRPIFVVSRQDPDPPRALIKIKNALAWALEFDFSNNAS
jgi:hypothetical protein